MSFMRHKQDYDYFDSFCQVGKLASDSAEMCIRDRYWGRSEVVFMRTLRKRLQPAALLSGPDHSHYSSHQRIIPYLRTLPL